MLGKRKERPGSITAATTPKVTKRKQKEAAAAAAAAKQTTASPAQPAPPIAPPMQVQVPNGLSTTQQGQQQPMGMNGIGLDGGVKPAMPGQVPGQVQGQVQAMNAANLPPPTSFPFDPRLITYLGLVGNPQQAAMLQRTQPHLFEQVRRAAMMLRNGQVSHATLQTMQRYSQALLMPQQQQQQAQAPQQQQQPQPQIPPVVQTPPHGATGPQQVHRPPPPMSANGTPAATPTTTDAPPETPAPGKKVTKKAAKAAAAAAKRSAKASAATSPVTHKGSSRAAPNSPPPPPSSQPPPPISTSTPSHRASFSKKSMAPPTPAIVMPPPPPQPTGPPEEWQGALNPNLPVTSIQQLPPTMDDRADPEFGGMLPVMSKRDAIVARYALDRDIEFSRAQDATKAEMEDRVQRWSLEIATNPPWWMIDKTLPRNHHGHRFELIWPVEKQAKREKMRRKGRPAPKFSKGQCKAMASVEDNLVPIRLDLDEEQYKIRDTFVWNVSDETVTPEMFARTLCEDFNLPEKSFVDKIAARIREAVAEAAGIESVPGSALSHRGNGLLEDDDWWHKWRSDLFTKSIKLEEEDEDDEDSQEGSDSDIPLPAEELMARLGEMPHSQDLRIKIQLDIISGTMQLSDTFEWDLLSSVTPEEFAETYAADLGLNGEFKSAIVHDMREQIQNYVKSLIIAQYRFDGRPVWEPELANELLPQVTDPIRRDDASIYAYTPVLNVVTDKEVALHFQERLPARTKKARGSRGRRGALNLPDREPIKTMRTRLSDGLDENGIPIALAAAPIQRSSESAPPVKKDPPPQTSRRAAAIAARANITSMTNEVDDDFLQEREVSVSSRPKRNRVNTETPAPSLPDLSSVNGNNISEMIFDSEPPANTVKQETEEIHRQAPEENIPAEWHCANCGRPESALHGSAKHDGPSGPGSLCETCSQFMLSNGQPSSIMSTDPIDATDESKPVKRNNLRIQSPDLFEDVASPDSSDSSDNEEPMQSTVSASIPLPLPSPSRPPLGKSSPSRPPLGKSSPSSGGSVKVKLPSVPPHGNIGKTAENSRPPAPRNTSSHHVSLLHTPPVTAKVVIIR